MRADDFYCALEAVIHNRRIKVIIFRDVIDHDSHAEHERHQLQVNLLKYPLSNEQTFKKKPITLINPGMLGFPTKSL